MPRASDEWFKSTFNDLYPVIYAHRSRAAAEPEVQFAVSSLQITQGQTVLDLCCGDGRHLSHLRTHCRRLVGLDYSPAMLHMAQRQVDGVSLVRADMRNIPFEDAFDVVLNFFTSFGYFDSANDNARVVRGVASALKPGGRFLIDYMNPTHIERTLVPQSRRSAGEFEIHECRWIAKAPWRVHKTTQVYRGSDMLEESHESVQLYTPEDFTGLLREGGLTVDQLLGNLADVPLDDSQPRMVAIGHRS